MKKPLILLALACITALFIWEFASKQEPKYFFDFVDVANINNAKILNNNGNFHLNKKQLENLKQELSKMTYDSNTEIKAGGKTVTITINNKDYTLATHTNGELAQVTAAIATKNKSQIGDSEELVFKTNGLNLDNYDKNE